MLSVITRARKHNQRRTEIKQLSRLLNYEPLYNLREDPYRDASDWGIIIITIITIIKIITIITIITIIIIIIIIIIGIFIIITIVTTIIIIIIIILGIIIIIVAQLQNNGNIAAGAGAARSSNYKYY